MKEEKNLEKIDHKNHKKLPNPNPARDHGLYIHLPPIHTARLHLHLSGPPRGVEFNV